MPHSPEDLAVSEYLKAEHEVDLEMAALAGYHLLNGVISAFRAGAKWQREQQLPKDTTNQGPT
jgi:hypothetical protein